MSRPTPFHRLTKVNQERQTAICSVCGPTEIYIAKGSKPGTTRFYCRNRIRESDKFQAQKLQDLKRIQNPNPKPRHSLSNVDTEKMIATCSVCGKTDIRKHKNCQKGIFYICAKKKSAYARLYRLTHRTPKPRIPRLNSHSLSHIDDENKTAVCRECGPVRIYVSQVQGKTIRRCSKSSFKYTIETRQKKKESINQYLLTHRCKRCGYNDSPLVLQLHRRNPKEKDDKIYRLVLLSQERLLTELEKSDVFCMNCHRLIHAELGI